MLLVLLFWLYIVPCENGNVCCKKQLFCWFSSKQFTTTARSTQFEIADGNADDQADDDDDDDDDVSSGEPIMDSLFVFFQLNKIYTFIWYIIILLDVKLRVCSLKVSSIGYNEFTGSAASISSRVIGDNTYATNQLLGKEAHRDRRQTRQEDRIISAIHRTSPEPGMKLDVNNLLLLLLSNIVL